MRQNLGYKIVSLAIAIVIWLYAYQVSSIGDWRRSPHVGEVVVPLRVEKLEPGCVITSIPKTVRVQIEGMREHVEQITTDTDLLTAYVNLAGKGAGTFTLPVLIHHASDTGTIKSTPDPSEVVVTLDQKVSRTFKVGLSFAKTPMAGYQFSVPDILPGKALVRGMARKVGAVTQLVVAVDPEVTGATGIDSDYPVSAQDKNGQTVTGVEIVPQTAHVKLKLANAPSKRIVFVIPNLSGQPAFPYKVRKIEVTPQVATVTGPPQLLMRLDSVRTEPIHLAGSTKSFDQDVKLIIPSGVNIQQDAAVHVSVEISSDSSPAPVNPAH
jgi:YbbR domain-containing protein